ncbi:hypothetical protein [Teredinibacter turnerae]|uniref:hypothetical protein n=1 Tax=Teredinibacter turnerae TaxID=2426 RepID=UPI0030D0B98E
MGIVILQALKQFRWGWSWSAEQCITISIRFSRCAAWTSISALRAYITAPVLGVEAVEKLKKPSKTCRTEASKELK